MSEQDLSFLLHLDELSTSVRMYDAVNRKLVAVDYLLPWPVKFMMIRYHHKHVFESRTPPSSKTFLQDVTSLEHKFRWRAKLKHNGGEDWKCYKHKMCDVTPHRGFVEPALRDFLIRLRSTLASAFRRARRRTCSGNFSSAFLWARQWLTEEGLMLAPFDKESGCCLIRKSDMAHVKEEVMRGSCYEPVSEDLETLQQLHRARYFRLAAWVAKTSENDRLGHLVRRSMNNEKAWYSARLMVTLKSHKCPPLTWRNIHGSPAQACLGLSAWLTEQLKPIAASYPWLLSSTEELVKDLRRLPVPTEARMYRADVKEFFMSGSAAQLSKVIEGVLADVPQSRLCRAVLDYLLAEQFVVIDDKDTRVWRVTKGSGLGLKHSNYIADIAFAVLGDEWACRKTVVANFGIHYYKRFRDDLLIISSRPERMYLFFRWLRSRVGKIFRLELTEVSRARVTMLAVDITVIGREFVYTPRDRVKHVPLSINRAHPPSVHAGWLVGYLLGLRKLCTRPRDWGPCVVVCLLWFRRFFTPRTFVDWIRDTTEQLAKRDTNSRDAVRRIWLVCDWHSVHVHRDVGFSIRRLFNKSRIQSMLGMCFAEQPIIGIAYRVAGRRLFSASTRSNLDGRR